MDTKITCPICDEPKRPIGRYPNYVCKSCLNNYKTLDKDGNEITYSNINWTGGISSMKNGIKSEQENAEVFCYVNSIECFAQEARFGGIVISTK
jgi:hypothetical protein